MNIYPFQLLGDTTARFVSQLFVLMGTIGGVEKGRRARPHAEPGQAMNTFNGAGFLPALRNAFSTTYYSAFHMANV